MSKKSTTNSKITIEEINRSDEEKLTYKSKPKPVVKHPPTPKKQPKPTPKSIPPVSPNINKRRKVEGPSFDVIDEEEPIPESSRQYVLNENGKPVYVPQPTTYQHPQLPPSQSYNPQPQQSYLNWLVFHACIKQEESNIANVERLLNNNNK